MAYQILLITMSIGLAILSFTTLQDVGIFVFSYHVLDLGYKCIIAFMHAVNSGHNAERQMMGVTKSKPSPYSIEGIILCLIIVLALLALLLSKRLGDDLSNSAYYVILVNAGIVLNCICNWYNGIKALYSVRV